MSPSEVQVHSLPSIPPSLGHQDYRFQFPPLLSSFSSYSLHGSCFFVVETINYAIFIGTPAEKWTMCNEQDMAKFLGLFFLMGINRLPTIRHYWMQGSIHNYLVFRENMTGHRFRDILRNFHGFNNRAVPAGIITLRTIITYMINRFQYAYLPKKHLSIDEGGMGRKGQLSFRVYNRMKPQKYVVKLCMHAS